MSVVKFRFLIPAVLLVMWPFATLVYFEVKMTGLAVTAICWGASILVTGSLIAGILVAKHAFESRGVAGTEKEK